MIKNLKSLCHELTENRMKCINYQTENNSDEELPPTVCLGNAIILMIIKMRRII